MLKNSGNSWQIFIGPRKNTTYLNGVSFYEAKFMSSTVNWSFVSQWSEAYLSFVWPWFIRFSRENSFKKKYKILNKIFGIELTVYLEKNHNKWIIDKTYKYHIHHGIQDMSRVASASVLLEPRSSPAATPSCTGCPSSRSHAAVTSGSALPGWSHVSQWPWWLGHHEKLFLLGRLAITMQKWQQATNYNPSVQTKYPNSVFP